MFSYSHISNPFYNGDLILRILISAAPTLDSIFFTKLHVSEDLIIEKLSRNWVKLPNLDLICVTLAGVLYIYIYIYIYIYTVYY